MSALTLPDTGVHLRNQAFSSFLDLSRWVAAWIVLLGHLRAPLFPGWGELAPDERNPLLAAWYFGTGLFGEAVIVFFVLSGYLVGGIGIDRLAKRSFSLGSYAVDRLTRLYVAYFPALVLTAFLGAWGMQMLPDAGLYDGTHAVLSRKFDAVFAERAGGGTFLSNLAMLQTFRAESFGANPPLWTISAEFWFYVSFGLVAWSLSPGSPRWARALALLLFAAQLALLTPLFLYYLGLWCSGVLVALLPERRGTKPWIWLAIFAATLVAARFYWRDAEGLSVALAMRDYGVAAGFAGLLYAMRGTKGTWLVAMSPINRKLADFSFSLYLIHYPLMIAALSALYAYGGVDKIASGYTPGDPEGLAIYAGLVLVALAAAWCFAQLTERHTGRLRVLLGRSREERAHAAD